MARTTTAPRTAEPFLPAKLTLPALREAAAGCMGCDLYQLGTQTVFGEGSADATVVFVGEQPGDQEDRSGRPFVGPAAVTPRVVVCLGATAAQSLLGKDFRVTKQRGEFLPWPPPPDPASAEITATVHPSSILRAGDRRPAELELFVADLRKVAAHLS